VCLFLGGAFVYGGIKGKRLADASSQQPETISLKNLVARGPEGNPNIILTDYQLCDNFVYAANKVVGIQEVGSWTKVWVPIVPRTAALARLFGGAQPAKDIQALIYSTHVGNQAELHKLATP
jgi:hypothetical protein